MNKGNIVGAAIGGTVGAMLGWTVGGSVSARKGRGLRTVVEGTDDRLGLPALPAPGESYLEPLQSADGRQEYLLVLHNTTKI